MQAKLVPLDGSMPIDITLPLVLLGGGDECDVQLEDGSVSYLHCVIAQSDGLLLLRDLGSANGTWVNDIRVCRAVLFPGELLQIGQQRFRVEYNARRQ
jgi:predicted component of type VI protein secretion system